MGWKHPVKPPPGSAEYVKCVALLEHTGAVKEPALGRAGGLLSVWGSALWRWEVIRWKNVSGFAETGRRVGEDWGRGCW